MAYFFGREEAETDCSIGSLRIISVVSGRNNRVDYKTNFLDGDLFIFDMRGSSR